MWHTAFKLGSRIAGSTDGPSIRFFIQTGFANCSRISTPHAAGKNLAGIPGAYFINVLRKAFTHVNPKSAKMIVKSSVILRLCDLNT